MVRCKIYISLKKGVLDPQGKAILNSLRSLAYKEVKDCRVGKYIEMVLDGLPMEEAKKRVEEISKNILSNPLIEDYQYEIIED